MIQLIQDNLNNAPKTLHHLVWNKITRGICLNDKELEYLKRYKIKGIINFGLIENGCWIKTSIGDKFWHKYGELHREDGPAVEYVSGVKIYYLYGKVSRKGGPAVEYPNGYKGNLR